MKFVTTTLLVLMTSTAVAQQQVGVPCKNLPARFKVTTVLGNWHPTANPNCAGECFDVRGVADEFGPVTVIWSPANLWYEGTKSISFARTEGPCGEQPPFVENWKLTIVATPLLARGSPVYSQNDGGWLWPIGMTLDLEFEQFDGNGTWIQEIGYQISGDWAGNHLGTWRDAAGNQTNFPLWNNPPGPTDTWHWSGGQCCGVVTGPVCETHPGESGAPPLNPYRNISFRGPLRNANSCRYLETQFSACRKGSGNLPMGNP